LAGGLPQPHFARVRGLSSRGPRRHADPFAGIN